MLPMNITRVEFIFYTVITSKTKNAPQVGRLQQNLTDFTRLKFYRGDE